MSRQNSKSSKRPKDLNSGNPKRSKRDHKDESEGVEESSPDYNQHLDDSLFDDPSSLESTSDSIETASSSTCQDELDRIAEVVFNFDIKLNEEKSKKREQLEEVVKAEFALQNTSGGIIKINFPHKPSVKEMDDWFKELYEKRKTLFGSECGEKDSFDDVLDIPTKESTTYIFVRKSSVPILTDDSHLKQRSEERNYKVILYSRICNLLDSRKQRCNCANKGKFATSFRLDDALSYESLTKEHKLLQHTDGNLAKALCERLSDNIVAFANTIGGTVYFGIEDKHATIKGEKISDEQEKADIHRSIVECMERKVWVSSSGEEEKPKEGYHYHIKFFPVDGADDNTYVIAVHICAFPGTAVFKKKPECSVIGKENEVENEVMDKENEVENEVIDKENKVVNMKFKEWLSIHKSTSKGSDEKKLKRRIPGRTVYYTVQDTIQDIYSDLIEASPGRLKIRPKHVMDSIRNPKLQTFIHRVNEKFKNSGWKGITFIERCWRVNMGFPNTKPAEVICDVLIASPNIPLLLVSLAEKATTKSFQYNKKLATTLKRTLAREGGCIEKFYVKPVVLTCSKADDALISPVSFYPDAYQMSDEKYEAIVKALVPVLARVSSSGESAFGEHLFHLLTKEQYDILFENFESPKLMISGPPGSGKTVLAIERIHRLRRQGVSSEEVLFICSNKVLEAQIRNMKVVLDGNSQPLCSVHNYFGMISFLKSYPNSSELARVKHILIDECQSFKEKPFKRSFEWWNRFLELYVDRNPSLWIFHDMTQQVIVEPCVLERLPDGFTFRQLNTVIRTTGKIQRFICERFLKDGPAIHLGHDFEGEDVEVLVPKQPPTFDVSLEMHLLDMLISILERMVKNGVDPGTIGVLFTDEKQKKQYRSLFDERTRNVRVKDGKAVHKHGSIVFDTIRVFSGDDKDVIIGFCPGFDPKSGFQNNDALMVSLCSRAKLKLVLILEKKSVASSFGLADCIKDVDVRWDEDAVIDFQF